MLREIIKTLLTSVGVVAISEFTKLSVWPGRSLNLLMKQRAWARPSRSAGCLTILVGQDVVVDRLHHVEDFGNIAWIVWESSHSRSALVGPEMDQSFK